MTYNLPNLPYGTPLEGSEAGVWACAILQGLGAPITAANVYSFAGWFRREGGGGSNNPLNTTLGSQYPAINSDGVRNFPTPQIGVEETVATLNYGYNAIVASFKAGVGLEHPDSTTAAELSKWSGGGYSYISPVVVPYPRPVPPDPHHYSWFDDTRIHLANDTNTERNVVENYDKYRKHPIINHFKLRRIHENLVFLLLRLEHVMHDVPQDNAKYHREWRYFQLKDRVDGKRMV